MGSSISCSSCPNGFSLVGTVCISHFNYVLSLIFDTTLPLFQSNYLTFLGQVSTAVGVKLSDLAVNSIVSGSVVVNLAITSYSNPGSAGAITSENNLNSLLQTGSLGNMNLNSFSLATVGGDNNITNSSSPSPSPSSEESGLSTGTILILAIVIPVGTISNYGSI